MAPLIRIFATFGLGVSLCDCARTQEQSPAPEAHTKAHPIPNAQPPRVEPNPPEALEDTTIASDVEPPSNASLQLEDEPSDTFTSPDQNHELKLWSDSCTVEILHQETRYRAKLSAVGPCSLSHHRKGHVQIYPSPRGPLIIVGSSKSDGSRWCDVQLHGLLFAKDGPELSIAPQTPKMCGVDTLDEISFALLSNETEPMKPIETDTNNK